MTLLSATSSATTAESRQLHPSVVTEVLQLTGRNLRKITREPTLVFFSLAMPIIMLTLFGQVFKSIAQTPNFPTGVSYIDYLLPAVLCTTLVQSATRQAPRLRPTWTPA